MFDTLLRSVALYLCVFAGSFVLLSLYSFCCLLVWFALYSFDSFACTCYFVCCFVLSSLLIWLCVGMPLYQTLAHKQQTSNSTVWLFICYCCLLVCVLVVFVRLCVCCCWLLVCVLLNTTNKQPLTLLFVFVCSVFGVRSSSSQACSVAVVIDVVVVDVVVVDVVVGKVVDVDVWLLFFVCCVVRRRLDDNKHIQQTN